MSYSDSDSSIPEGLFDSECEHLYADIESEESIIISGESDDKADLDQDVVKEQTQVEESKALKPRSYQLEMLEKSLERNIIVAVCLS